MDAVVVGYILAGLGGIAGVGLVPDRFRGRPVAGGGGGSSTPNPDDDTSPRIPWWLGGPGPVLLGLLVAELVWIVLVPQDRTVVEVISPLLTGVVAGAATRSVLQAI